MRLSVIPYAPRRNHNRWLLKLHGCITHAHDIVITKDDYAAYATDRRHALAGIVQAQLMTNHMLFVGFSCEDSNYKRILGSVIDALTLKVPDTGEESSAVGSDSGATGAADGNNLGPMNGRNSTMGSSGGRDTCGAPPDSPVDQDWSLGTTLQMLPIAEAHCQQPSAYTAGQQVVAMAEATEDFAHSVSCRAVCTRCVRIVGVWDIYTRGILYVCRVKCQHTHVDFVYVLAVFSCRISMVSRVLAYGQ